EMEGRALSRGTDEASVRGRERLRQELADRQEELNALVGRWEQEKAGLNKVGELKKQLDEARGLAERAQRDGDFETASRIMYGEVPRLEQALQAASEAAPAENSMVKEEVGPDDIAEVISSWTGIPAGRLLDGESAK